MNKTNMIIIAVIAVYLIVIFPKMGTTSNTTNNEVKAEEKTEEKNSNITQPNMTGYTH